MAFLDSEDKYYFGYRYGLGNVAIHPISWLECGINTKVIKKKEITEEEYNLPLIDLEVRYPFNSPGWS